MITVHDTHINSIGVLVSKEYPLSPAAPTTLKSPSSPDVNLPDDEELEYQRFIYQKFQDLFDLAGNNRDLGAEHELKMLKPKWKPVPKPKPTTLMCPQLTVITL